jgi:hypothetical protein
VAAGNGVDLGTLVETLARIGAKVDRLGTGQQDLAVRVGNVEDGLLRVREAPNLARKVADESLRLIDTKLALLRVDVLQAVDTAARSGGTHARTFPTAQLDALAHRVDLLERSRG